MPLTYEPIATTTLGSAQADITFTSIPGTYTDLVLVLNGTTNTANGRTMYGQINSDTASNYSATLLAGDGTTASSSRASNQTFMYLAVITPSGSSPAMCIMNINNYANSTTNKTILSRASNVPDNAVRAYVNLWRKTPEAITSIKLYLNADSFGTGTVATLYGIRAA